MYTKTETQKLVIQLSTYYAPSPFRPSFLSLGTLSLDHHLYLSSSPQMPAKWTDDITSTNPDFSQASSD